MPRNHRRRRLYLFICRNLRFSLFDIIMGFLKVTSSPIEIEGIKVVGHNATDENLEILRASLALLKRTGPLYFKRLATVTSIISMDPSLVAGRAFPISRVIEINPLRLQRESNISDIVAYTAGVLIHESTHCILAHKYPTNLRKHHFRIECSCNKPVRRFVRKLGSHACNWTLHFPTDQNVFLQRLQLESPLSFKDRLRILLEELRQKDNRKRK
jgi:hypothetical protein